MSQYLRPKEASAYLRDHYNIPRTPLTLAKDRCHGDGPEFVKFGRLVLYPEDMLRAWAEKRLSKLYRSTTDDLPIPAIPE